MPAYQIYRGDVFELVDQATSFIMSRIDNWTGTREEGEHAAVPTHPELPIDAVKEAIVNAATGTIQAMPAYRSCYSAIVWKYGIRERCRMD